MITANKIYTKLEELIGYYDDYLLNNDDAILNIIIENDT